MTIISSADDLYHPPDDKPHRDLNWFETECIPQSMQFMIDLLPTIRRLIQGWPRNKVLEVLDIGAASASGANLLATLHRSNFMGVQMKVDAMDITPRFRRYALHNFKNINYYEVGNIFEMDGHRSWDLVICSHTIEHIKKPDVFGFIKELQRRARHWAVFYTPYMEQNLLSTHVTSFNGEFISTLKPLHTQVINSPAWRHPIDKRSSCVLFVLMGLNTMASTAKSGDEVKISHIRRELIDKKEDYQTAITELSALLEKLPANGKLNYLKAYCLHRLNKNLDEAISYYDRALELGFDEFLILFHEGSLYFQLGEQASARTLLRRAALLKPFHEATQTLLRQLG